jgi:hypothetical protein
MAEKTAGAQEDILPGRAARAARYNRDGQLTRSRRLTMRRRTGTALLAAALLGALGAAAGPALRAGDKGETKVDPKVVAEQKAAALKNWKRVFDKADPPQWETSHFLLFGEVEGRKLKEVGDTLEKAHELAAKVLELGKQEPWPGKLAVYFALERRTFAALVRHVEKRRPEAEERGSVVVKSDTPSVIASPGKEAHELTAELEAAAQIGAALVRAKGGEAVPSWVVEGFGRATAFRAGPPEQLSAEHRRAATAVVTRNRAARSAWSGTLKEEDAAVVRASLIEYLAYSGRVKSRFLPFLMGFRPPEDGQPARTTEAALAVANIAPARLTGLWHNWVRTAK